MLPADDHQPAVARCAIQHADRDLIPRCNQEEADTDHYHCEGDEEPDHADRDGATRSLVVKRLADRHDHRGEHPDGSGERDDVPPE